MNDDPRIPEALQKLEDDAFSQYYNYNGAYVDLKKAVSAENKKRFQALYKALKKAGEGFCRGCSRFKKIEDLKLILDPYGLSRKTHIVWALCPGCFKSYDERTKNDLALVRQKGRQYEVQDENGDWDTVRTSHPAGMYVFAPRTRINTAVANRYGVLPTIHLNWKSAPPEVPVLTLHQPIKRPQKRW